MLGGVVAVVIAAVVVVIIISSSGAGTLKALTPSKLSNQAADGAGYSPKAAVADVKSLLDGIPQSGNTLGKPNAPVTITEFGDLVCSTCDAFALSSEPQLIQQEVRTGKVKLVFRADDTASGTANQSEWQATQVAASSAGLQDREWYYVLLIYDEQPITIGGQDAELVPYVSTSYLQNRAEQVPGLNLNKWQANLGNSTLIKQAQTDLSRGEGRGAPRNADDHRHRALGAEPDLRQQRQAVSRADDRPAQAADRASQLSRLIERARVARRSVPRRACRWRARLPRLRASSGPARWSVGQ